MELSKSKQRAILIATILASGMAFIDSTALNVTLPALQRELGISGSELLWIVNGYALFLSALLLAGGALGDLYGRKRVFGLGIILFTVASVMCGLAGNALVLIGSRCLQGIGGALMVPGSLSIISALFPESRRGWAIGTWSMFSALTTIWGPALGGWLAENGFWRLVFFINVPLSIIALIFLWKVPESKNPHAGKLDVWGTLLATAALGGLTYGLIEAPERGFGAPVILLSLIGGALMLLLFLWVEGRSPHAMMPLNLFRSRMFSGTNLLTLLLYSGLGGFLFFFPLNLIQFQGYSAELAGLTMLPLGIIIALMSRWAGALCDRFGAKPLLIVGTVFAAIGFYLFTVPGSTAGPADYWTTYFPAIVVLAVGLGFTVAPLTTAVMNAVPTDQTGIASGVNNTISRSAGVLGVAVMGAIVLLQFESSLMEQAVDLRLDVVAQEALRQEVPRLGDAVVPPEIPETQQQDVRSAIRGSFLGAYNLSGLLAALLVLCSALTALLFLPWKGKTPPEAETDSNQLAA